LLRAEAADFARVSVSTIDRAIRAGELDVARCGRRVRISRAALLAWINGAGHVVLLVLVAVAVLALVVLPLRGCAPHRHSGHHRPHHHRRVHAIAERTPLLAERVGTPIAFGPHPL